MTQNGVVKQLLTHGRARVEVERGTACGGSCGSCEACVYDSRLVIDAENDICARPGDRVVLESGTGGILGAALLVYMLPVVFLFAGYALGAAAGLGQGLKVMTSLIGVCAGGAIVVFAGRRRRRIVFRISGYQR